MNTSYTIQHIDSSGTIVFTFSLNGHTYTCGENFGQLQDITNADGTITTAGQQLDQAIKSYMQQHQAYTVPASIQTMIGQPQVANANKLA